MIVYPNCKINLGLNVLNRRKDGYHNIRSVFVPIPWHDALEIIENKRKTGHPLEFSSSGLPIEGKAEDNICCKAYRLLDSIYPLPPVKIHLHKVIPMGAGLGGGSSDGAFALMLLNEIFQLNLSKITLHELALKLSSDSCFFIRNRTAMVEGIGDKIHGIDLDLKGKFIIVIYPNIHIETREAYQNLEIKKDKNKLNDIAEIRFRDFKKYFQNDFESYAFSKYPELKKIKDKLYERGAFYAAMSGSGSALFGIFHEKIKVPKSWKKHLIYGTEL